MGRELWEMPDGPPVRPEGVPVLAGGGEWVEGRHPVDGEVSTRLVWPWISGEWRWGSVRAEARNSSGWWLWVWWPSNPLWVHESATRPYAPSPEEIAAWRSQLGDPELPREDIL